VGQSADLPVFGRFGNRPHIIQDHAMQGYAAYKQTQDQPLTRIDLILTLYRKALDHLGQAAAALADKRPDNALPHLNKTQLIVVGMASGLPAFKDETAVNFLRLYEFVAYQLAQCTSESVAAAANVLRTLLKGFEAVREQAASMEMQGKIPSLDRDRLLSVTA
jgi:flagellar protein FliS